MRLFIVDFYLDWPKSVDLKNLRKFIMINLLKKGGVIRWSIIDIKDSKKNFSNKKLRIKAVLIDTTIT